MREIDLQTWPRRKHFEVFNAYDYPHFNLSAPVDVTCLVPFVKERGLSLTVTLVYLLARAANDLPEFRWRIRGRRVVEHEIVHPSTTVLVREDLFSFCTIPFNPDFAVFTAQAAKYIELVKQSPTLEDEPGRDDLLFMTAIPWVSFTGVVHPIHMHPSDSVPRIAWGKYYPEGGHIRMPLSVQVHHALMDGLHVGRYFQRVQELFDGAGLLEKARPGLKSRPDNRNPLEAG